MQAHGSFQVTDQRALVHTQQCSVKAAACHSSEKNGQHEQSPSIFQCSVSDSHSSCSAYHIMQLFQGQLVMLLAPIQHVSSGAFWVLRKLRPLSGATGSECTAGLSSGSAARAPGCADDAMAAVILKLLH